MCASELLKKDMCCKRTFLLQLNDHKWAACSKGYCLTLLKEKTIYCSGENPNTNIIFFFFK